MSVNIRVALEPLLQRLASLEARVAVLESLRRQRQSCIICKHLRCINSEGFYCNEKQDITNIGLGCVRFQEKNK